MSETAKNVETQALQKAQSTELSVADMESLLMQGDLQKLPPAGRLSYYRRRCEDMGLDPLARPFDYIILNGKLQLYANKGCFEQLRANRKISIEIPKRERFDDLFVVTARAIMPDGRVDEATGAVSLGVLKGEAAANAIMKAETKAKRRVTLSICGLGMLDETEIDSIPSTTKVKMDAATGEVLVEIKERGGHIYRSDREYHDIEHGSAEYCPKCKSSSAVAAEAGGPNSQHVPRAVISVIPKPPDDLRPTSSDVPQNAQNEAGNPPLEENRTVASLEMPQAKRRGRPAGMPGDIGPFMEHMERAKRPFPDGVGEVLYYDILKSCGFEKKSQVKTKADRDNILRKMIEKFQDMKLAAAREKSSSVQSAEPAGRAETGAGGSQSPSQPPPPGDVLVLSADDVLDPRTTVEGYRAALKKLLISDAATVGRILRKHQVTSLDDVPKTELGRLMLIEEIEREVGQ